MKRWAYITVALYGASILILTWPAVRLGYLFYKDKIDVGAIFSSVPYWIWFALLLVSQWMLLALPVDVANQRPVTKRPVVFLIVASTLMMGLLTAGLTLAVAEVFKGEASITYFDEIFFGALGLSWMFWAVIFSRRSRGFDPKNLIEKQCRLLFRGSILQLLVVVPSHVLARSKDYCCAGMNTFIGIACGLAVMLFSFGPAVFFLYAEQWKKLHPSKPNGSS